MCDSERDFVTQNVDAFCCPKCGGDLADARHLAAATGGDSRSSERSEMRLPTKEEHAGAFRKTDLEVVCDSNQMIARVLDVGRRSETP